MRKQQQGSTLFVALVILAVLLIFCLTAIKSQLLSSNYNTSVQYNILSENASVSAINEAFQAAYNKTIEISDNDDCYKGAVTENKVLACPITPKYALPSPTTGSNSIVRNARHYGLGSNAIGYLSEQPRWYIVAGCNTEGYSTSGINSCDNKGIGDYLVKMFSVGTHPNTDTQQNDFGYIYTVEYAYVRK